MKSIDEAEARGRFADIVDESQRQPIVIRRQGQQIAIVVSMAEFERLRVGIVRGLLDLSDDIAHEASAAGLSGDRLSELLDDDKTEKPR